MGLVRLGFAHLSSEGVRRPGPVAHCSQHHQTPPGSGVTTGAASHCLPETVQERPLGNRILLRKVYQAESKRGMQILFWISPKSIDVFSDSQWKSLLVTQP